MPEPAVTTQQTTQTTTQSDTSQATQGKESYDANGRLEGAEGAFLTEGEGNADQGTQATEGDQGQSTEETQIQTTDTGKAAVQQPELLAGKYKTPEELKSAFEQLGGDPSKYDTPEKLSEAYQVREAEFTRARQELAERQRIEQASRQQQPQNPQVQANEVAQKIIQSLDFNEIDNVQQLVEQLVPAIVNNMPTNNQPQLTPEQLAEKLQPAIQAREERLTALKDLEKDVPRLGMKVDPVTNQKVPVDPSFRKAFAVHLMGGNYPRSASGLKQAMTDFLNLGKSIAEATMGQQQQQQTSKANAQSPTEQGQGATSAKATPEDDILQGIMGAYEAHNHKVGVN